MPVGAEPMRARQALVAGVLLLAGAAAAFAQEPAQPAPQERRLAAEFRHESEDLGKDCALKASAIFPCAAEFLTGTPLHLAVGSLAPTNGFAVGPAFVTHYPTTENWDVGWNTDAVVSPN